MLNWKVKIKTHIIFILVSILIIGSLPTAIHCKNQSDLDDNAVNIQKIQKAFADAPDWLLFISNHLTEIQSQGQYYKLLAKVELANKSLRVLEINQEDFIESILADKPDIKRVNENIYYLIDSLDQVSANLGALNLILRDCGISDNLAVARAIGAYPISLVRLREKMTSLDSITQFLLGEQSTTFSKSKDNLVNKSKDLLRKIRKTQLATKELYDKVKNKPPDYEP